jgi:hypothetical protein
MHFRVRSAPNFLLPCCGLLSFGFPGSELVAVSVCLTQNDRFYLMWFVAWDCWYVNQSLLAVDSFVILRFKAHTTLFLFAIWFHTSTRVDLIVHALCVHICGYIFPFWPLLYLDIIAILIHRFRIQYKRVTFSKTKIVVCHV